MAHSVTLDEVTHQNADVDEATGERIASDLGWNGTEWVSTGGTGVHGGREVTVDCAGGTGVNVWEVWTALAPLPDGSFRGTTYREATTNGCGMLGERQEVPAVAVRIGDVPAGIF